MPPASLCSGAVQPLGQADIFRARSFRALPDRERHSLTFAEFFETDTVKVRHVEEHVTAGSGVNESESFIRHPLDRAFGHNIHLLKTIVRSAPRQQRPSLLDDDCSEFR